MAKSVEIYNYGESELAILTFSDLVKSVELRSSDYYLTHQALSTVLEALGYTVTVIDCEGN